MSEFGQIGCCITMAGDEYQNTFRMIVGHHPYCSRMEGLVETKTLRARIDSLFSNAKKEIASLKERITNLEQENFAQSDLIAKLEGILSGDPDLTVTKEDREHWRLSAIRYSDKVENENAKLQNLLVCATSIDFSSPDFLERDFDSLDENYGKWRFQREWQEKPTTGFETALEAFEAMQKATFQTEQIEELEAK